MMVSVIITIYQAEKYLKRCLDSVMNQTIDDYEVVLVDDGCFDKSPSICDEYSKVYSNVKVIHKSNGGVSAARQTGLDNAIGDYVIFTDPDDWVEPDYLELLYNKAIETDSDMVICDFMAEFENKSEYSSQNPFMLKSENVLDEMFPRIHGSTWNKLVRRELLKKYNITFPTGVRFCEDLYVICSLLKHDIKVEHVEKALYHYDQFSNPNSLVKHYDDNTYDHDIRLFNLFIELFKNDSEPENMRKVLMRNLVERAFFGNQFSSAEFKKKFYPYREYIKQNPKRISNILLYMSCIGYYRFAYKIYFVGMKIKSMLRKVLFK